MTCENRVILACVLAMFVCATAFAEGGPTTTTNVGTELNTTDSGEKSKSDRESKSDSDEKGGTKTNKHETGSRRSARREVSRTLDRMNNASLQRSLNVVGLFANAASDAGLIRLLNVNDLLTKPIGGNATYHQNLQTLATRNAEVGKIARLDVVKPYIIELYRCGQWISRNLSKAKLAVGIGKKDWEEIARLAVVNDRQNLEKISEAPNLTGSCRFAGQYTRFRCGSCVLDLSYAKGLPELVCGGLAQFGPESAGGETIVVQASETASLRDAETQATSDETFSAIMHSVDDYVKWASSHSKAVEAAAVKRQVMSKAVKNSSSVSVVIAAMQNKEDPARVMGLLGLK